MNETSIELIKLYNGDFIIGEVMKDDGIDWKNATIVCVKNPRQVLMLPMSGSMSVALKPVCFPFTSKRLKDEIAIQTSQVMFMLSDNLGEIEKEIVNGYKSDISGIKLASAADAASLAGNGPLII